MAGDFCEGFDSPIEHIFAMNVLKYIEADTVLHEQFPSPTPWGDFRIDFVLERGKEKLGIECDGAEFHQDEWRDEVRDALILGAGHVYHIERFTGSELFCNTDLVFFRLVRQHPIFFAERALGVTDKLLSNQLERLEGTGGALEYFRKHTKAWHPPVREFWRFIHRKAQSIGPCRLDTLLDRYWS